MRSSVDLYEPLRKPQTPPDGPLLGPELEKIVLSRAGLEDAEAWAIGAEGLWPVGASGQRSFRVRRGRTRDPSPRSGQATTGSPTSGCSAGLCGIKAIRQPAADAAGAGGGAGTARLSATILVQPVCPPWGGGYVIVWPGGEGATVRPAPTRSSLLGEFAF